MSLQTFYAIQRGDERAAKLNSSTAKDLAYAAIITGCIILVAWIILQIIWGG